jgi:hypothetical protein
MMIKRIFLAAAILLLSTVIKAQDNKYGIWYGADASYKIVKNLRFELAGCLRTDQNASNVSSFYFDGGLKYKFNKYFSAGAYYRFTETKEKDDFFYARHRWYVDLNGSLPIGRFTLSGRYRFQEQFKMYIKDPDVDEKPVCYNRFKLSLDYDIPKVPLVPSLSAEIYGQTFSSNDIMIEKTRYTGGLKYNISKKHSVGVDYIYLNSKNTKPKEFNVISLYYSFKF